MMELRILNFMVIMIALEVNNIINTMQILERRNEKFVH